jgi:putative ABC transport system substrate-binding protein
MFDMTRREFIILLGGAAAWPGIARAQPSRGRMQRVGILMPYAKGDAEQEARIRALRDGLQNLGWTEGANVAFDERWATDNMETVRANAASLVNSHPDAIVAIGGRVIPVLLRLTQTIPVVVPGASDPVGTGWVDNLARPGRNVTGFTFLEFSIIGKMLEVLKQVAPAVSRVALIFNPDNPNTVLFRRPFEAFSAPLAVEPTVLPVHGLAESLSQIRRGIGLPFAGCGVGLSRVDRGRVSAGKPHRADRVRDDHRPGRRRMGREPVATRHQRHRICLTRIQHDQ